MTRESMGIPNGTPSALRALIYIVYCRKRKVAHRQGKGNANKIDNAAGRKRLSKKLVVFLSLGLLITFCTDMGRYLRETIRPRGTFTIDLNLHISLSATTKIHRVLLSKTGFTKRRCNGPLNLRVNSPNFMNLNVFLLFDQN